MTNKSTLASPSIWMLNNPIASSLLTFAILIFGFWSFNDIEQQTSPSFKMSDIQIEASYLGASPKDIEQSIILPIEYELKNNANIERISATATESVANITLELVDNINPDTVIAQVKNSIDGISSFPNEMEKPTISFIEEYDSIVEIGIHGSVTEQQLYHHASILKKSLLNSLDIAKIDIQGARSPEIIIEVKQAQLQQYKLTMADLLDKVNQSVKDVPAGTVITQGGELIIRTQGRKNLLQQFSEITVFNDTNGQRVSLTDIATVSDSFQGHPRPFLINSEPGLELKIYQQKATKPLEISAEIQQFIAQYQSSLPKGLTLTVLQDQAEPFRERISLLTSNGIIGMFLVVLVMTLFLDARLAFWVSMGIPIAIIGTLGLMPYLDIPINMVTLFAFIITLGILVDDAVIVAETIYLNIQLGKKMHTALIEGVKEMTLPVVFSVATNMIAFIPLLYVPGELGVMYKPMTMLIFAIFFVSLIEALLILPLHLKRIDKPMKFKTIAKLQLRCSAYFDKIKHLHYARWLKVSCNNPLSVIVIFIALTSLVFTWVASGRVDISFIPKVESTRIDAEIEFPVGTTLANKLQLLSYVEQAGIQAMDAFNGKQGYQFRMQDMGAESGSVTFMIVPEAQRDFTARQFVNEWRTNIGDLPGVKSLFFDFEVGPGGGKEIVIELGHEDEQLLTQASLALVQGLKRIAGVADIDNALSDGNFHYSLTPTLVGKQLGFTSDALGREVRLRFNGGEAIRQIMDGEEVKIRVIMDKQQHYYAHQLKQLILIAPNGESVELGQVATIAINKAPTQINRVDSVQLIEVTASILRNITTGPLVMTTIEENLLSELRTQYPELSIELGGAARIESKVNIEIIKGGAIALGLIFALLAIIFKRYLDAVLVLSVIPFCLAAAMFGHILMGYSFSVMSLFGMIALSGLVINGAFVMLLKIKALSKTGMPYQQAVMDAALNRFRPVVLTALTTAAGLVPMLFETSTQALYLVPMVISLSFGSVFSIATILLLSPALFIVCERVTTANTANKPNKEHKTPPRRSQTLRLSD